MKEMRTLAHYASIYNLHDIILEIIKTDISLLGVKDEHGKLPLYYASFFGHSEIAKTLVDTFYKPLMEELEKTHQPLLYEEPKEVNNREEVFVPLFTVDEKTYYDLVQKGIVKATL